MGRPTLLDVNGSVFLNRGNGSFASPLQLCLGPTVSLWAAVAGDLNTDGLADFGGAPQRQRYLYILLAADDETFLPPVPYATVTSPQRGRHRVT